MDRLFRRKSDPPQYEPVPDGSEDQDGEPVEERCDEKASFSRIEYYIFLLLGVAMLWAWNMFLAAAPYFQRRFRKDAWILDHFQSAILSVSTIANLASMVVLTKLQSKASYPKRITCSLILNIVIFTLLALSTTAFRDVSARTYLFFILAMVFAASLATGLSQNGVFAYVSGFERPEYTQAIMTGQAVAGVLPCIAQIASVFSVPERDPEAEKASGSGQESSTSACSYFLTATAVSTLTLFAFFYLVPRQARRLNARKMLQSAVGVEDTVQEPQERKSVGIITLFKKLRWLAGAVFLCFAVTMVYPVFTQAVNSVRDPSNSPRIFHPASFIPLGFLFWNAGDLLGRLSTLLPVPSPLSHPRSLLFFSLLRLFFVPLYYLCNLRSRGATPPPISSDFFYLVVVQLGFGLTNGWLGSLCMIKAPEYVAAEEREAAGGFMGLMLVGGLTVGSLLSFVVAGV